MPELPTVSESGIPGFEVIVWYGVFAPAATPRPVIGRLNGEIRKVVAMPDVKERMSGEGAEAIGSTPEELAKRIKDDIAKWADVVRSSGARAD